MEIFIRILIWLLKIIQKVKIIENIRISFLKKLFKNMKVAFIMDGNRRYGKLKGISDLDSKKAGRDKFYEMIVHCRRLGISEVTTYALSTKNLNRPKFEIENMYKIITDDYNYKYQFEPIIKFYGFDIDEKIQKRFKEIEKNSGNDMKINILFSYSGTKEYLEGKCFVNKPDIIIRTSGICRLSDFLISHVANGTKIKFVKPLWPMYTTNMLEENLFEHIVEDYFYK